MTATDDKLPPARADEGGAAFAEIDSWVFDLDNTLYPAACDLFGQVSRRMTRFVADRLDLDLAAAHAVQKDYFRAYGTTLRGMMIHHDVDPRDYLGFVHDIDLTVVPPAPGLDAALGRLPGRKVIFTNGSVAHATRVMERLGVAAHFDGIFDIVAGDYVPKPDPDTYRAMARRFGIAPVRAVMIDDIPANLAPAAALGMTTVWVRTETEYAGIGELGDHVHHVAEDLTAWLEGAVAGLPAA